MGGGYILMVLGFQSMMAFIITLLLFIDHMSLK